MRYLPLLLAATGCAVPQPTQHQTALQSLVGTRVPGAAQKCVPILNRSQGLQAIDSRILFYRAGGTLWVNRLPDDCRRLTPNSNLIVDIVGNRYCRGDTVKVVDAGSSIPVGVCTLGDFTPYQ